MVDWERLRHDPDIKYIEKLVEGYSYADGHSAVITDEKFCSLLIRRIRESKATIFNMIEFLYEVEREEPLSRDLQRLKDELDIFSDEIKARFCDWADLDEHWIRKLVWHDVSLIKGLEKLNEELQEIYEKLIRDKSLATGPGEDDRKLWEFVKSRLPGIGRQVDGMVVMFKEREGICNLRPLSLEKTYDKIREKIGEQI